MEKLKRFINIIIILVLFVFSCLVFSLSIISPFFGNESTILLLSGLDIAIIAAFMTWEKEIIQFLGKNLDK